MLAINRRELSEAFGQIGADFPPLVAVIMDWELNGAYPSMPMLGVILFFESLNLSLLVRDLAQERICGRLNLEAR